MKQKIQYGLYLTANGFHVYINETRVRKGEVTSRHTYVSFYVRWDLKHIPYTTSLKGDEQIVVRIPNVTWCSFIENERRRALQFLLRYGCAPSCISCCIKPTCCSTLHFTSSGTHAVPCHCDGNNVSAFHPVSRTRRYSSCLEETGEDWILVCDF